MFAQKVFKKIKIESNYLNNKIGENIKVKKMRSYFKNEKQR